MNHAQKLWAKTVSPIMPLLTIIMSTVYVLWLRGFLDNRFSTQDLTIAGAVLAALLVINAGSLKKQQQAAEFFENKPTLPQQALGIAAVITVFIINSLRYYDIMPIVLAGESNLVLERAKLLITYWNSGAAVFFDRVVGLSTYNWGLSLIYAPFKSILGEAQATIKIFTLFIWAGILGLLLWVFVRRYNMRGTTILLLAPAMVSAAALMSVRTYKWHVAAALASSSIIFLINYIQRGATSDTGINRINIGALFFGALLIALSVLMYHATIIYIPIMLGIITINFLYSGESKHHKTAATIFFTLSIIFIISAGFLVNAMPSSLMAIRFKAVVLDNAEKTNLAGNIYSFLKLFLSRGTSWPMGVLFLLGLSAGLSRWKTDVTARTIVAGFLIMLLLLLVSYGTTNLDENCYIVIFYIGIILLGIREFFARFYHYIKPGLRAVAMTAITLWLTVSEAQYLYQHDTHVIENDRWHFNGKAAPEENNLAQLLLMDAQKRTKAIVYFPDASLKTKEGGFDSDEVYGFDDTVRSTSNMRTFSFFNKLKSEVSAQLRAAPETPVLVYYNSAEIDLEKTLGDWGEEITVKNIVMPYPVAWVDNATLSYLAIYHAEHSLGIQPSPHFNALNDPQEPMINRVRRLARIVRGNDTSNYF